MTDTEITPSTWAADEYRRLMHEFVGRYADIKALLEKITRDRSSLEGQLIAAGTAIRDKDALIGQLERALKARDATIHALRSKRRRK